MADIFATTPEGTLPDGTTTSVTPIVSNILDTLVGEGKKYASAEDLAKGYSNADVFINQLKDEQGQLRGELDKRLNAEDMVDTIKREREELRASQETQENTTPQLNEKAISDLISQTLDQRNTQTTVDANIHQVDSKMKELFGTDKAGEVVQSKAIELGVSVEYLQDVAAKSPKAFYSVIGIDSSKTITPSMTASTTNTEAVSKVNDLTAVAVDSWESFEALRRSDPKKYFTPAIQNKLFAARQEKGETFIPR